MLHRRTSAKWLHVGMVRLKQHTISFVMVTSKHAHQCLFFTKALRARCLQRRCTHFLPTTSSSEENRSLCTHDATTISRCEKDRNSGNFFFFRVSATMCPFLKFAGTGRRMNRWPLLPLGTHLTTSPGSSKPVRLVSPGRLCLEWCGPCEHVLWNMREWIVQNRC